MPGNAARQIVVTVSALEKSVVEAAARSEMMSISAYVRRAAVRAANRTRAEAKD
jgi:uncharacterized protein (DUF1778 family)